MPEPRSPWVVALSGTMALRCERCGEEYQPKLPCPVDLYVAMAHKFEEIHRECKAKFESRSGGEPSGV